MLQYIKIARSAHMKNEPIRHHYIPQFILRNFCFDNKGNVHYYDKKNDSFSVEQTRNVFMSNHLYRDEINAPENPTIIEQDLAVFENEVSQILKDKFLKCTEFTLDMEEDAKLKLFFAIMGFRSERVRELFKNGLDKESKRLYSKYQNDRNFEDLWKRNLGFVVKCRSSREVIDHLQIDDIIKLFFHRDTIGISGMYFVVAESYCGDEFVIGDTYPVEITGSLPNGILLPLYSIFPLSPKRVLLVVSNGAKSASREVSKLRPCVLSLPKMDVDGTYTYRVKRLYSEEVKMLNAYTIKEAKNGVVYRGID